MKKSKYNFFIPFDYDNTKMIAYNSRSNGGALISKNNYNKYLDFVNKDIPIDDDKFLEDLKKGFFLINDDIDELKILRYNLLRDKFNTRSLAFTIAPTSDCNFRCVYCYEKDAIKPTYMLKEEQDRIINLVKDNVKYIHSLNITWYGGEPLLAFDAIEYLSEEFIKLCEEFNVNYSAGIITNGYLLTKDKLEKFKRFHINFMQITLDGTAEHHNISRPHKDKVPTYEKIISNLEENYSILPQVALRINVDKSNIDSGVSILNELIKKGMCGRISPYMARIVDDNNCYDCNKCIDKFNFLNKEFEFYVSSSELTNPTSKYPTLRTAYCGADRNNSFIINADGKLYKCWTDIGREDRSIGKNIDSVDITNKTFLDYLLYDPTQDEKCSECKFLPICMGSCPFRRITDEPERCTNYKYELKNYLNHEFKVQLDRREKIEKEKAC